MTSAYVVNEFNSTAIDKMRALGAADAHEGLEAAKDRIELAARHGAMTSQALFDQYEFGYLRELGA